MKFRVRDPGQRVIAAVMLFVWFFTLATGIASACVLGEIGSGAMPGMHHGSTSPRSMAMMMASDGDGLHVSASDDEDQQWAPPGPLPTGPATERMRLPRPHVDQLIDLDPMTAAISHWPRAVLSIAHIPALLSPGRISTDLPLFIRFRRLIPSASAAIVSPCGRHLPDARASRFPAPSHRALWRNSRIHVSFPFPIGVHYVDSSQHHTAHRPRDSRDGGDGREDEGHACR